MSANDAEKGQRLFLIRPEGEGEQEGAPFTVVQHSQWMLVGAPGSGSLGYIPAFNCPSSSAVLSLTAVSMAEFNTTCLKHNSRLPLISMINS